MLLIKVNSGAEIDLTNLTPASIDIADIAAGLSKINRYAGATHTAFSVAQHSVLLVAYIVAILRNRGVDEDHIEDLARAALLHDAHEYLTNDVPTPIKRLLEERTGVNWDAVIERPLQEVIFQKYQVPIEYLEEIKIYDTAICYSEMVTLFYDQEASQSLKKFAEWPLLHINPLGPEQSEKLFLQCFKDLFKKQRKYQHA